MTRWSPLWRFAACCLLLAGNVPASEPAADLEVGVRTLLVQPRGDRARVKIELQVAGSPAASPRRSFHATVARWEQPRGRSSALAAAAGSPARNGRWTTRFWLELDAGRSHDLRVVVDDGSEAGPQEVHHRVVLDEARAPRLRHGAIEFRGLRPSGRGK